MSLAYRTHPHGVTPFKLAIIGIWTQAFALQIKSRYPSVPMLYVVKSGRYVRASGNASEPRDRSESTDSLLRFSCSSKSDGNTTAAIP
jgi:hypothetical protein